MHRIHMLAIDGREDDFAEFGYSSIFTISSLVESGGVSEQINKR